MFEQFFNKSSGLIRFVICILQTEQNRIMLQTSINLYQTQTQIYYALVLRLRKIFSL